MWRRQVKSDNEIRAENIRHWAEQFRALVRIETPPGRDQSTALTKIDEAELWAMRSL